MLKNAPTLNVLQIKRKLMNRQINVIGAGLAGCEAAYQLAERGICVSLYEMKPDKKSEAHMLDSFAELVCSNSLKSNQLENAAGLLKQEMREFDSLIMKAADASTVPAGSALAVDRLLFSEYITNEIENHPNITVIHSEITEINVDEKTIIATGPLTSNQLSESIKELVGQESLSFYDAAAPIVMKGSINMDVAFFASRYGKGGADYLNCPMDEPQYRAFYEALMAAERVEQKSFENLSVFEGCMPIEVMASRGYQTLLYGPLKPVGLSDPRSAKKPFAVVQLRKEDEAGTLYNLVGFQTNLKHGEQKRVFSMIPGLERAEFVRLGVMHRNTFINSPKILDNRYRMKNNQNIYFAGQITGVEGYIESAASGMMAGLYAWADMLGKDIETLDDTSALGALSLYVSRSLTNNFQPMHINFAIIKSLDQRIKQKRERNQTIARRAIDYIKAKKKAFSLED